jgi:hypothetical protein
MTTAMTFLILGSPFAVAAALSWAAHRSDSLRIRFNQFRWSAPMMGRLFEDDRDGYRCLIGLRPLIVDQMTGTGHVQIRCPVAGFIHLEHLPLRGDRVGRLDQKRRHPHVLPLRPVVPCTPFSGDVDPDPGVTVQPPAGFRAVERLEEVLAGHRAELVVNLRSRCEFDGQGMQPRFPRTGGAAAEVRRHVLDDERLHQFGPGRRQTPRVQCAHRVADQGRGPAELRHRIAEVVDESLRADRMRVGDVAASMPRRVIGVHLAVRRQPRQLTRPGTAPAHQAVHQHQRLATAPAGDQQFVGHRVTYRSTIRSSRGRSRPGSPRPRPTATG